MVRVYIYIYIYIYIQYNYIYIYIDMYVFIAIGMVVPWRSFFFCWHLGDLHCWSTSDFEALDFNVGDLVA